MSRRVKKAYGFGCKDLMLSNISMLDDGNVVLYVTMFTFFLFDALVLKGVKKWTISQSANELLIQKS